MKHILYALAILFSVTSWGQVTGISIEPIVVHTGTTADGVDLNGYTTYRVYAECATESTVIKSVWGNSESPLVITTTGNFYNQLFGNHLATGMTQGMLDNFASCHFDSWITLDLELSQGPLTQIYFLDGFYNSDPQITSLDSQSGTSFICNSSIGEIWSSNVTVVAGSDLKILVAQLTTDGDLGVQMNFQYALDGNCGTGSENITLSAGNPQIGCSDTEACNYDPLYDPSNAQVCTYPGCTDVFACNFDPQASCDDGSCSSIYGCMNPLACNYNPLATCSDGSCIYAGCTDPLACNYNANAGCDNGSCTYPFVGCTDPLACNFNLPAICNADPCSYPGCTDPTACNFEPNAGCDDGSCIPGIMGCMDPLSCNYYLLATCDDNSCTYPGCTNPTACNYNPDAACDDGSCEGVLGCMNALACNYNANATCDDGNCQIGVCGCTDIHACNYWPAAEYDNGTCFGIKGCMNENSCDYNPNATCSDWCTPNLCHDPSYCNYNPAGCDGGYCANNSYIYFYRDLNNNGTRDMNEPSLNSVYEVTVNPGITYYVNSAQLNLSFLETGGPYTLTVTNYPSYFTPTTPLSFDWEQCQIYQVGFFDSMYGDCYITKQVGAVNCDWTNCHLFFSNQHETPVNATVVMTFEDTFSVASINNNGTSTSTQATWNLVNLNSFQNVHCNLNLHNPGLDQLGESFSFNIQITVYDLDGNVLCQQSNNYNRTFTCPYDPNNKTTDLAGYRDEHFILESDVIPYTINFQNTGNAPATQVIVADTLDTSVYDLSTLEITGSSHEMYAIIEENGSVQFVFENINLPDSSSDELGSRGYIMYNIEPLDGLLPFTELVNDADIYFDSNPPIQTNSTTHTIFHCSLMEEELVDLTLCDGAILNMDATHDYVEEYAWVIEGQLFTTAPELTYQGAVGVHTIELQTANPLCEQSFPFELNMAALPEVSIVVYWNENSVNATGGIYYDWYTTESGLIPDQHGEIIAFESILIYGLEVYAIGTDSNGCQNTSNTELLWSIDELEISKIDIWPNPFEENIYFNLPSGKWQMSCFDTKGNLIFSEKNLIGNNMINLEKISSGMYTIIFKDEKGQLLKGKVIRE
ncbi:MAG: T9SS type A sorting domain-containing protein [Flavobacteriales bacterium]|nr:T9SS type A sorting domain-containing protein [Flavobacteriales bacterium]